MEERYLSLSEAAEALDISERTAHRWIKSGKLRSYKPGRDHKIPQSAIIEAIAAGEVRPKAPGRSPSELTFNGLLAEERRSKLEEAERAVQYSIGRAEWYEQELEHGRLLGDKTAARAADRAYILAALAREEFSSLNRWFFNVVARDLVREIENGNASELVDEFDSLEEAFIERISRTQRMLFNNTHNLKEYYKQKNTLPRLRKTREINIKSPQHSA